VHVLRSPLLGAAVVDERGRLAGLNRLLDLLPGHHVELDQWPGRLRVGRRAENNQSSDGERADSQFHGITPYANLSRREYHRAASENKTAPGRSALRDSL